MTTLQIVGRTSSLFTRVPLIFAEELGVPYELVPISGLKAIEPAIYAGNPALKMPILRDGESVLFGSQNICRAIAARATEPARIVWPEDFSDTRSRNAHELVAHSMTAQVQIAMGTFVCGLPAENVYFQKALAGLDGALRWLDERLDAVLRGFPERDLSFFEVSLFCLMEHFALRPTVAPESYPSLVRFAQGFATRSSAQRTTYR